MLLLVLSLGAQEIKLPASVEKLAARAKENVDVTLDASMLQLAGGFLSDKNRDESEAKKIVSGLKGIYVRSFEFAKAGEYSAADVDAIRDLFRAPQWTRVVGVRGSQNDGENVDVFLKNENNKIAGLAVIAAEAKELTIVSITGSIDPEQLSKLGGQFGIPKVDVKPRKEEKK
jgi:hypothetical protein